ASGAYDYERSGFGTISREENGTLVNSQIVDPKKPPSMPRELREILGELDNIGLRARMVTYKDASHADSKPSTNGWSMCQAAVPLPRGAARDEHTRHYLVPL